MEDFAKKGKYGVNATTDINKYEAIRRFVEGGKWDVAYNVGAADGWILESYKRAGYKPLKEVIRGVEKTIGYEAPDGTKWYGAKKYATKYNGKQVKESHPGWKRVDDLVSIVKETRVAPSKAITDLLAKGGIKNIKGITLESLTGYLLDNNVDVRDIKNGLRNLPKHHVKGVKISPDADIQLVTRVANQKAHDAVEEIEELKKANKSINYDAIDTRLKNYGVTIEVDGKRLGGSGFESKADIEKFVTKKIGTWKQADFEKFAKAAGFKIDKCLSSGGRVSLKFGKGVNTCITGVIDEEMKLAKKSGNTAKFSKFGRLVRGGGYLIGWADIPIELAFALPHLLSGNMQDAKAATTAGLFGYGGKKLEQIDQEKNPEAYKYFKHVQDINDWMDAFNQQQNADTKLREVPEDYAETYKKHGDKSGYIDFQLKQYNEAVAKQEDIAKNYKGYVNEEGEEDPRLIYLGKEEGKKYLRETEKKEWEEGMPIRLEPFSNEPYHWAPFKEDKITSLEQQVKQKGESFYGGFMKPGVKAAAERLGVPDLYDDWYNAFYGKDPREAHSSLPLEWTDQLAELEKKELYQGLADKLMRPGGAELKKSLIEQGFDFEPFREYNLQTTGGWMSEGGRAGYMGGGITGIRRPNAIPPERQGLRSIMIGDMDD